MPSEVTVVIRVIHTSVLVPLSNCINSSRYSGVFSNFPLFIHAPREKT
jgi:hypothetical protein